MKLGFTLDTYGTCVSQLMDELRPLEEAAAAWLFPYDIFIVFRVLPEQYARQASRRFDSKDHTLYLDISIGYEQYLRMSKHEQREALGIYFYDYLSESVAKYKKHADPETQIHWLGQVKQWMLENNWLNGQIHQARELLSQDVDLYEVSRITQMSLEEVEYIFTRMCGYEQADIHPDNITAAKAPPYSL